RAASGVVLITTRRGGEQDARVTYNFEYGLEIPGSQPRQVGFQRYLEMVNELRYNDNPDGGWFQEYTEDQVLNWVERNATDPDNYPITDWYKLMVKGSAPRQSHTLNFTGGTQKVKTRATLSYDKVEGLFKEATSQYERVMARVNNDFKINKWLSTSLDLNVNYAVTTRPEFSSVWSAIFNYSPAYAPIWSNGGMGDVKSGSNPYGRLVEGGEKKTRTTKVGGKASIDITPIDGLRISGIVAPNLTYTSPKTFTKAVGYNPMDDPTIISGYLADHEFTALSEERNHARSVTWQALANYMKSFGRHELNLLLGYESYYYYHENLTAETSHFDLDRFPFLSAGNKEYASVAGDAYENAYQSYFGRAMYNYDDRYLVQFNIRRDGSSRFARKYRWGTFPSVSLGWVMSQESFMRNIDHNALSFLKLRGSWGRLGNERIGNYPYIALMEMTNSLLYGSDDATSPTYYKGAAQIQYAIDNITWETTESWDLGLDARFLNNRLSLTADFYTKNTRDMLLALEIPKYVGYANPEQNAAKMNTKGYDIELAWNDRIGDWGYSIAFNFSDYVSKMKDMKGRMNFDDAKNPMKVTADGTYFQEWYGYEAIGLFQTEEEVANSPKINATTQVGDIKYRDIDGDRQITPEKDRVYLGNSLPRYLYGGNVSVTWKGFDFAAAFRGVGSQKVRMTEAMVQPFKNNWGAIPGNLDGRYWSSLNTPEQNLAAEYPRLTYVNRDSNNAMSTFWLFNGRYFRMKNLTLGYTLPKALTSKAYIDRLRVYVSANDLFCIHNYPKGYDPERTTSQYPLTKQVLFGLSVNF
ncbi:MAG: SusC/RagA family TonB-linked outer membrane protein, partial [Muribaculaceae bacterium]|nr:SusC/RagA family TonB-linked outer membrane protein [Muribaculaceae bacterium]